MCFMCSSCQWNSSCQLQRKKRTEGAAVLLRLVVVLTKDHGYPQVVQIASGFSAGQPCEFSDSTNLFCWGIPDTRKDLLYHRAMDCLGGRLRKITKPLSWIEIARGVTLPRSGIHNVTGWVQDVLRPIGLWTVPHILQKFTALEHWSSRSTCQEFGYAKYAD